jgi:hypothetical protein
MADHRRQFDESARRNDRDWLDRPRDDRHSWFDDRNSRYESDRMSSDNQDERGSAWESGPDRPREQREDYLRWSTQNMGVWADQTPSHGERERMPSWLRHERRGSWRQHEASRPHMVGRGPKGYQRSDDRIREDVCDRMTEDPILDASEIEIDVSQGEVRLSGSVTSREQKRRAEDIAERIGGVRDVTNQLRVMHNGGHSTSSRPASEGADKGTPGKSTSDSAT